MGYATGKWIGEDLEVHFTVPTEASDFGPGTIEVEDLLTDQAVIDRLEILGVEVNPKDLPLHLRTAIYDLASEVEYD